MKLDYIVGCFEKTTDEKGRVVVPIEMLDRNSKEGYLRRGSFKGKNYIDIIPSRHYNMLVEQFSSLGLDDPKREEFFSRIIARFSMDRQGRVSIPKQIREKYGFCDKQRVRLTGIGNAIRLRLVKQK